MPNQYIICREISESDVDIVSVDGTVIGADIIYDHHHKGGAWTQMDELPEVFDNKKDYIFVSPTLDEDCAISTAILCCGGLKRIPDGIKLELKLASLACDQLTTPNELFLFIKDYDYQNIATLKEGDLTPEEQLNERYKRLVSTIKFFIQLGQYEKVLKDKQKGYFDRYLNKQRHLAKKYDIVSGLNELVAFVDINENSFVSPWVYYDIMRKKNLQIALVEFRSRTEGRVYTIGIDPDSKLDKELIFDCFEKLNELDESTSVDNKWGGRSGVGGSPQLSGSSLLPTNIANVLLDVFKSHPHD